MRRLLTAALLLPAIAGCNSQKEENLSAREIDERAAALSDTADRLVAEKLDEFGPPDIVSANDDVADDAGDEE